MKDKGKSGESGKGGGQRREKNNPASGDYKGLFDDITRRIEQVREEMKLNPMAFCREIGFPYIRYHHVIGERRSKPTTDLITSVVTHTNVNADWLLKGDGHMNREGGSDANAMGHVTTIGSAASDDDYVLIPLYGVRGSAGDGQMVHGEEVEDLLAFKKEWITQELRTSPDKMSLIHVQGESMVPTLNPGDVILLELANPGQISDGIFVIRMGEALLVKRLQFLPEGKVNVTSDNSAYQAFRVNLKDTGEDFAVIGRVVWAGRRF